MIYILKSGENKRKRKKFRIRAFFGIIAHPADMPIIPAKFLIS
jgi:hypothetical protein